MLTRYKNIIWDFDGVIINSHAVKDKGFATIFEDYPSDKVKQLMDYHHANGGMSRFVKIRYFFETILQQSITEEQVHVYAQQFSNSTKQKLTDPGLLIPDTVQFIRQQHSRWRMHIVSGSEEKELRFITHTQGIDTLFLSIYGSPLPKKENVERVLQENQYDRSVTCLIGDSINDYDAATANGIDFYGYNQPALRSVGAGYIESFAGL